MKKLPQILTLLMKEQDFWMLHPNHSITQEHGYQFGRYDNTPYWWIDGYGHCRAGVSHWRLSATHS